MSKENQPKSRRKNTVTYEFKVKPLNSVDLTFKFKEKSLGSTKTMEFFSKRSNIGNLNIFLKNI